MCQCRTVDEIHAQQRELIRLALLPYPARLKRFLLACVAADTLPKAPIVVPPITRHYGRCRFCGSSVRLENGMRVLCPCRASVNQDRARRSAQTLMARRAALRVEVQCE